MPKHLRTTSKRTSMLVPILVAVALVGIVIGWKITQDNGSDIIVIQEYPLDTSDKRQVVGLSDNVFVGQVLEQTEVVKNDGGSVYTLFSVRVDQNIKGNLSGIVTVRQPGGYDEDYAAMQVVNGDSQLHAGGRYLLTTSSSPDNTLHTMFAGFGWASLDGPRDPTTVIAEYEQAFREQIVDPAAIKSPH